MDNKQGVDDDEEMVRVPKGIEASELLEERGQIEPVTPEPGSS